MVIPTAPLREIQTTVVIDTPRGIAKSLNAPSPRVSSNATAVFSPNRAASPISHNR
jgi:hypothetical protein